MTEAADDTAHLFDLSGKVAVVTGARRGIGAGIAHTLPAAGAAVVCAARRTDEIDSVACEALAERAISEFGHLDIWVSISLLAATTTPGAGVSA